MFFVFGNTQYHYLIGALIGVTALVLAVKGHPAGQALTIVFPYFTALFHILADNLSCNDCSFGCGGAYRMVAQSLQRQ